MTTWPLLLLHYVKGTRPEWQLLCDDRIQVPLTPFIASISDLLRRTSLPQLDRISDVRARSSVSYDRTNDLHVSKLAELWTLSR